MRSLILTAIGPDRPGLVEKLSATITANGGNWLGSRMAHLGGEFAGIVRVQVADDRAPALEAALADIEGLEVSVKRDHQTALAEPGQTVRLELTGADRPGIVSEISRTLAAHGVNVENLDTECVSAPMSGEALFKAQAELAMPADLTLAELQLALEQVASDLMVDLSLGEKD